LLIIDNKFQWLFRIDDGGKRLREWTVSASSLAKLKETESKQNKLKD
jgi:hypothetical protein